MMLPSGVSPGPPYRPPPRTVRVPPVAALSNGITVHHGVIKGYEVDSEHAAAVSVGVAGARHGSPPVAGDDRVLQMRDVSRKTYSGHLGDRPRCDRRISPEGGPDEGGRIARGP